MGPDEPRTVRVSHFSDVLCVWAYVGQVRLSELHRNFGPRVELVYRYLQVFGHTRSKLDRVWGERGGPQAYNAHVREIAGRFSVAEVHPELWLRNVPASSAPAHAFIKAVDLVSRDGGIDTAPQPAFDGRSFAEEVAWRVRLAFFRDLRDVGRHDVLLSIADELGLPIDAISGKIRDGSALAELCADMEARDRHRIEGSPTYVLDRGRQKLYGNVGYRVIEANVQELLADNSGRSSWC